MKIIDDLLNKNPIYLVDVGASGGIHERWRKLSSKYVEILFEPDLREFNNLAKTANSNRIIFNTGLGASNRISQFNLALDQQKSSVFLPNLELLGRYPKSDRYKIQGTVDISMESCDSLLMKDGFTDCDFLKLDTQGLELEILNGSKTVLKKSLGVQVEVEFVELYKGQASFSDVNLFLIQNGFELFDLKRFYWKRKNFDYGVKKGQLIFGDGLYFRSPEFILSHYKSHPEKLIKAFIVFLVYGYEDIADFLLSEFKKQCLVSESENSLMEKIIKKQKRSFLLPDFKGKGSIRKILLNIASLFETNSFYSGTDEIVGNSYD
jgi:FkbM family methyltransferase